jgi:hypothetical protein
MEMVRWPYETGITFVGYCIHHPVNHIDVSEHVTLSFAGDPVVTICW